jgi:pilus assembly protein CpaB
VDATTRLLLGVGAALALIVGLAIYATRPPETRTGMYVVVARQDIPERTLFTASNVDSLLTQRELPAELAPTSALTQPTEAIGKTTTSRLSGREVVTADRLASPEGAGARSSALIPNDHVALTIPASDRVIIASGVQPGDRVDLIITWSRTGEEGVVTQDFLQDIRVFAVGQPLGGTSTAATTPGVPSVTLLLDYQQAVLIEHVIRTGGSVALALRRFDQFGIVPTEPVTNDRLRLRLLPPDGSTAP